MAHLAPITLKDGTTTEMARLESIYDRNKVVVLSIRNIASEIEGYRLQTCPTESANDDDWITVQWSDGSDVVFIKPDDAVLPCCNSFIRVYTRSTAVDPQIILQ
jgi:hypothetical protein